MGTITNRNGRYTALIRIKRAGRVVHAEAQTFGLKRDAANWMKRREAELAKPGALVAGDDPPLSVVIDRYIKESQRAMGRTKAQVLRSVSASEFGALRCSRIGSAQVVAFAQSLDCLPQTRANYLAHLGTLFAVAKPAWGYALDEQAMRQGKAVCKKLGLTSKTRERSRRPSVDELDRLLDRFDTRAGLPMGEVVLFALFSTRRQEEITRLAWDDLVPERQSVIVRDMKHPGQKVGNDVEAYLPDEAWSVVCRQPRVDRRIFPYTTDAIGAAFTKACRMLGIEDLHFHDLRHDGVSRLFEIGWDIPQVARVSGHRDWNMMRRYTHLKGMGDKYAGWARRP